MANSNSALNSSKNSTKNANLQKNSSTTLNLNTFKAQNSATPLNLALNSSKNSAKKTQNSIPRKMPLKVLIFSALLLSGIIIVANYTVQFQILGTPLTFGALTYPFSFLALDILSEKFSKKETLKALALGLLLAFYPSYLSATPQIAIASISAFCLAQPLDVLLFYTLKRLVPRIWWLRGISSTLVAQLFDTLVFFTIAFWGVRTLGESLVMGVADYSIKAVVGFVNVPLFWLFAISPWLKNRQFGY